jgi:hypothetical protein
MSRNWFIESIAFLAFFVLVFYSAWTIRGYYPSKPEMIIQPEYILDSIPYYVPVEFVVEKPIITEVPADIDSLTVAQAYFAKYPFTFSGDTNEVKIQAKGIISENQILDFELQVMNTRAIQAIYPKPQNELSTGFILSNQIFAPKINFRRKRWTYGLAYDLIPNNNIGFMLELNYQLKSW